MIFFFHVKNIEASAHTCHKVEYKIAENDHSEYQVVQGIKIK